MSNTKKGDSKGHEENSLDNLSTENGSKSAEKESTKKESNVESLISQLLTRLDDQAAEIKELRSQQNNNSSPPILNMGELVANVIKEVRKSETPSDPLKYVDPETIDPDDVLTEPKIFYAYSTGYVITDDRRNGKNIRTPLGNTIFFAHQATQKIKDGQHTHLHSYCTYPSWSKKEVKWLQDHSRFGVHFFETAREAMETNADIAHRIGKHLNALSTLRPEQLIAIAKNKGITHNDIHKMKSELALQAVQAEIKLDAVAREKYFVDLFQTDIAAYKEMK